MVSKTPSGAAAQPVPLCLAHGLYFSIIRNGRGYSQIHPVLPIRWYKSSDYFSIDNITLGYTLPKTLIRHIGLQSVRVFGSAENLWIFSARQGLDPRIGRIYVSSAWYAARRTISGGIKIVF